MPRWRHFIAYVILAAGLVLAFGYAHRAEQHDVARNCVTGQRSYDALKATVKTAYKPGSLSVNAATLPPETQRLLAALRPLLTASAGSGGTREAEILKQLGPRPTC
ncbi:MAG TPA: hypothetical protein VH914_00540 [Acidimicrobiia bacterium]|jgi:hypothetical protein|nr:hypothetical protein [Acidimicrobiia bacterium]